MFGLDSLQREYKIYNGSSRIPYVQVVVFLLSLLKFAVGGYKRVGSELSSMSYLEGSLESFVASSVHGGGLPFNTLREDPSLHVLGVELVGK